MSVLDWFARNNSSKNNNHGEKKKLDIPGNLWIKCYGCGGILYSKDLEANNKVCPSCDYHFKLNAEERIKVTFDKGSYREFNENIAPKDFLKFKDLKSYKDRITVLQKKSSSKDAITTGFATLDGLPVVAAVMDFTFMGGSMGSVVGEKFTQAIEKAIERNISFIVFTSSGGARMQEGITSLMQMAKTSAAVQRLAEKKLPNIVVLTDPTAGGTTASFAMLGDIHIAEKGALIAFAGPRVIEQTIRQKLPKGFQRSEYLAEHGMVDIVLERKEIKGYLIKMIQILKGNKDA